jgi:DNA/RNA endonuclease G (NUC1)
VIILENGQGLDDINDSTEIISIVMPNSDYIEYLDWNKYKTNIKRIESSTGYYFIDKVPDPLRNILENKDMK